MSTTTIETTYRTKGELMKRIERKNTKFGMSRILADVHYILTDETKTDAEKVAALRDAHSRIIWG